MLRFVREMIALRKRHPILRRRDFFRGAGPIGDLERDIIWHGVEPGRPDISSHSRTLAFALNGSLTAREPDRDFYVACNAWREPLSFRIPRAPTGRPWRRTVDTALASPLDIVELDQGPHVLENSTYLVAPYSLVVLISDA
jgi:glycogen operon protein